MPKLTCRLDTVNAARQSANRQETSESSGEACTASDLKHDVYGIKLWFVEYTAYLQQELVITISKLSTISWTAKHTNHLVMDKAGVSRNLLESVKARKLTYLWEICQRVLEADNARNNTRNPGCCTRGRPKTTRTTFFNGLDTHWTMTLMYSEDRDKWRQLVRGVAKPRNDNGLRQGNSTIKHNYHHHHHHHHRDAKRSAVASRRCDLPPKRSVIIISIT